MAQAATSRRTNPAESGKQYRLAQAVLSGQARKITSMTKKVAQEIVDKTPAKLRSAFAKGNPKSRDSNHTNSRNTRNTRNAEKNLFGFGKSKEKKTGGLFAKKTTYSSKLSSQAYNLGYAGKDFDSWISTKKDLDRKLIDKLREQHDKGWDAKHRDDSRKAEAKAKSDERQEEIRKRREELEIRQLRHKQETPPPLPGSERSERRISRGRFGHRKSGSSRTSRPSSFPYKGKTIRERDGKFEVMGTDWHSLKDAKEYVDIQVATGGKARLKNPAWSLKQGNSQAFVYEIKTGTYAADVLKPGSSMETHTFSGPHPFRAATSWARLRLHEVANPAGCKVKIFKRGNAKRNPIDKAEKAYEEFHGIPSKEILEYQEQEHRHSVLWGIGPLISMKVVNVQGNKEVEIFAPDPQEAKLGDVVMLTASEDGRQFIPVGGDQKLKLGGLESFGITDADVRDHMLIGTIVQLTYRTKKSFEKHGKEEVDFYHDLGKEGSKGICPVLIYKPRNPSMEIAGGRYQIAKPEGALGGVSPGIVG